MITWRPRCSEEAAVPLSGQTAVNGGRCFNAGTSVARDNRLATSVQTHFFDSGSAAAVGRQERWTQRLFAWLAKGGGRWKTSRARKLCGEAHWGGDLRRRKCENTLELQGGRTPAESPDQAIARESTLDKRRRRYGRAGVHTENAWTQTRRQRFGVAGRKTRERERRERKKRERTRASGRSRV